MKIVGQFCAPGESNDISWASSCVSNVEYPVGWVVGLWGGMGGLGVVHVGIISCRFWGLLTM